ncbi:glutamyl-tRNA reductase [Hazenella sp. IB182357]|uniref:Glutamyl-tRNA reductase n=1 Tax=Polycladospora coralii TaxID=2771432 RepID=A0A926NA41_9BACL|nr:glutamyl-tRNA reductase [Polycladospora coralii]MBD1371800.1 glutamyl-tRNA reductase [Polycladospora coralii]
MHTIVIGFNHKTAPVEIRERLVFSEQRLDLAIRTLRDMKSVLECVIVSTCNRMELYLVCDQLHTGEYYAKTFLESWFRIPREEFVSHLYILHNQDAVSHLLHVVCGLDSLVIGETQILGQVKQAFFAAQAQQATGTVFNTLFKQAITLGKKVHTETEIGQNAVSVSYAAVELGKKLFDSFRNRTILLIGAGKMSELTAKHFHAAGATRVLVINRTFAKAQEMAAKFQGEARNWDQLMPSLKEADIVVSSTGAGEPILTKESVEPVIKTRRSLLFLIDIAVPRDIDPAIHQIEQAFLYDIDDLKGIVDTNMSLRQQEAERVKRWIEAEVLAFQQWLHTLGVVPLISALREKYLEAQAEAMIKIERKLPHLTEQEMRVLNKQTKSIVNQLLHDPIERIKESAIGSDRDIAKEMFVHLFALEQQLQNQQQEMHKEEAATTDARSSLYACK